MKARDFLKIAIWAALLFGAAACGEGASLDVKLLNPALISSKAQNPFEGVTELEFKVFEADGDKRVRMVARASYESGKVSLDNIPTDKDLRIRATAYSNTAVVSWGESDRFRLPGGESNAEVTASIVMRHVDGWSPVVTLDESGALVEAPMTKARAAHTATLLDDGRVLIIGGFMDSEKAPALLNSAEIVDPASGERTRLGDDENRTARAWHTATKLSSGKVLVAGGLSYLTLADGSTILTTRKDLSIIDDSSMRWSDLTAMAHPFAGHTASLFSDGSVLFFGGYQDYSEDIPASSPTAMAYQPVSGALSGVEAPNARTGHIAVSLAGGAYTAILGGVKPDGTADENLLLYSPADNTSGPTQSADKNIDRVNPAAIQYDNSIFLLGGSTSGGVALSTTQLIPLNSTAPSGATPSLLEARERLCTALLHTGEIIAVGGKNASGTATAKVDLFSPATDGGLSRVLTADMASARHLHTCTLLENGQFLVTGGIGFDGQAIDSMEIYTPDPVDYPSW